MKCWNCKKTFDNDKKDGSKYCECVHPKIGFPSPVKFKKYIVKDFLGSGQYGAVFKCFDPDLQRDVAIKRLNPMSMTSGFSVKEMHAIAKINDPHVVQIYDSVPKENFFVMEYVLGGTLYDAIETDISFVIKNFTSLALDICDGLRAAHKEGICHRDLKSENILLTEEKKPKVSDFGLAKFITSSSPGKSIVGTLLYTAPDVLDDEYNTTIDIYSLGVIFYKIWTGQYPFTASTATGLVFQIAKGNYQEPKIINNNVPSHINSLIKQMICPKEERISSISLVASALDSDRTRLNQGYKERTIDDFQKELTAIYVHKNSLRTPTFLLDHFSTNISALIEGLRSNNQSYRTERAEKYFPKSFAWLTAIYSSLGVYLSEIIWCKFPNKCLYCDQGTCKCEPKLARPKVDINNDLLLKIKEDGLPASHKSKPFRYYQKMFARIYGQKNQAAGLDVVSLHAFLEINEARDVMLKIDSLEGFRKKSILHLELADLTAWFFALLNFYDDDYDFEFEFQNFFQGKCFACKQKMCSCPDVKLAPLVFWG